MNQTAKPASAGLDKLAYTLNESCDALGCRRTKIHEMIASGEIKARKLGSRTIILRDDLVAFLNRLPEARAA